MLPVWKLVASTIVIAGTVYLAQQVRKPSRGLGRGALARMNLSHSALTDWGLTHVQVEKGFTILDVGCGGGRTVQKLAAAASEGHVAGVDFAAGSVEVSRELNAEAIRAGRVEIQAAAVSKLPFPDATFDLVTAVETHYYWPDLVADAREIRRVLKPGGAFVAIAEAYKGSRYDWIMRPAMLLLRAKMLSVAEHRDWLAAAGFSDVQAFEERGRGWLCVRGSNGSASR